MSELIIVAALTFIAGLGIGAIISSVVKSNIAAEKRLYTITKLEKDAHLSRVQGGSFNNGRASGLKTAIILLNSEVRQ